MKGLPLESLGQTVEDRVLVLRIFLLPAPPPSAPLPCHLAALASGRGPWASWGHSPGEGCDLEPAHTQPANIQPLCSGLGEQSTAGAWDSGRGLTQRRDRGPRHRDLCSTPAQPALSETKIQRQRPRTQGQRAQGPGTQGGVGVGKGNSEAWRIIRPL